MWFLGFVAAAIIAISLVRYYAEPKTPLFINCIVAFSWALGFSYFLVLPFDIAGAMCRSCLVGDVPVSDHSEAAREAAAQAAQERCQCFPSVGLELLSDIIPICYGVTMLLGYLMNDLLRSYLDSGEFTRRGRLRDALKDAAVFYIPALIIGGAFLVYMIVNEGLTLDMVRAIGRGMFTCTPPSSASCPPLSCARSAMASMRSRASATGSRP